MAAKNVVTIAVPVWMDAKNAGRFLWTCGIKGIPVYVGVDQPIMRQGKHCPEIHGIPGEDGVSGMCGYHFPDDIIFSNPDYRIKAGNGVLKMVDAINGHSTKVTIVATGAQTNIAMALRLFPEIKSNIEKIVFMGGGIGIGNTGVAAEFNIELDPEAAYIVLHSGLPIVMVPLEVTHSVLVTDDILMQIKTIGTIPTTNSLPNLTGETKVAETSAAAVHLNPHVEYENIFKRLGDIKSCETRSQVGTKENLEASGDLVSTTSSPFANCCFELLTFFKSTYEKVFSFKYPPLHDPCTVFYVISPESFQTSLMFVDVETSSAKCAGRTLCDIHGILSQKPNVLVCTRMNLEAFWGRMLHCIKMADKNSPLNE